MANEEQRGDAVAREFERNMFEFFRLIRVGWPDAARCLSGAVHWCVSQESFAPLNSIFDVQLDAAAAPAALSEPVELAKARQVPMMARVTPRSRATELPTLLQSLGFVRIASWPVMVIDVDDDLLLG